MASNERDTAILLIDCPDQKGIVHQVCDFVLTNNGNIIKLDQHVDYTDNLFFMRIEWDLSDFTIPSDKIEEYFDTLIAKKHQMHWTLHFRSHKPKVAIFVSKYSHCIHDILSRYESGEWDIEISVIISNHEKFAPLAAQHNIRFITSPLLKQLSKSRSARKSN